jgi:hypothetical protein
MSKIHTRKPLQEFTVKLSKWRCGTDVESPEDVKELRTRERNGVSGYGDTELLNQHGFKCCLGFAVKASGYRGAICGISTPGGLDQIIPGLNQLDSDGEIEDSAFSEQAIRINDSSTIPVAQKMEKLIELGAKHGIKINFVP